MTRIRCTSVTFVIKSQTKIIMHDRCNVHVVVRTQMLRFVRCSDNCYCAIRFRVAGQRLKVAVFPLCLDRHRSKRDGDLNINRNGLTTRIPGVIIKNELGNNRRVMNYVSDREAFIVVHALVIICTYRFFRD